MFRSFFSFAPNQTVPQKKKSKKCQLSKQNVFPLAHHSKNKKVLIWPIGILFQEILFPNPKFIFFLKKKKINPKPKKLNVKPNFMAGTGGFQLPKYKKGA